MTDEQLEVIRASAALWQQQANISIDEVSRERNQRCADTLRDILKENQWTR